MGLLRQISLNSNRNGSQIILMTLLHLEQIRLGRYLASDFWGKWEGCFRLPQILLPKVLLRLNQNPRRLQHQSKMEAKCRHMEDLQKVPI